MMSDDDGPKPPPPEPPDWRYDFRIPVPGDVSPAEPGTLSFDERREIAKSDEGPDHRP
jgi:hypothetical protein